MFMNQKNEFLVGDIFYTILDGKYNLYKLLTIEIDFECYHILSYAPLESLPTNFDFENLQIFIYHAPFDKNAFAEASLLTNKSITSKDLIGYHEYLRQTKDFDTVFEIANQYYKLAYKLTDEKKYDEAIDEYSKAIDLYPEFFEAIDNRAFCKMDLGLWSDAIKDFQLSLEQNPNSFLAEFSIGECFFNLKDYKNAKIRFELAEKIDPTHKAPKEFLERIKNILNKEKL